MKKFLVIFIILILAAGAVFYFGWVQIQIPPENYAVFFSKTGGYSDEVIVPGNFVWKWERLIPKNTKLYTFQIEPRATTLSIEGELPSGRLYAEQLTGSPDFGWEITVRVSYSLKPEMLPTLVKEERFDPENIDSLYTNVENSIADVLHPQVIDYMRTRTEEGGFLPRISGELTDRLRTRLSDRYPTMDFSEITIPSYRVPDLELYREAKEQYMELMEVRTDTKAREINRTAGREVTETSKIDILREYGKLFTEYPILLRYLAMEGNLEELTGAEIEALEDYGVENPSEVAPSGGTDG
jgi:hypothetical protein